MIEPRRKIPAVFSRNYELIVFEFLRLNHRMAIIMNSPNQNSRARCSWFVRAFLRFRAAKVLGIVVTALIVISGLLLPVPARAADDQNEICFGCHSDKSMTAKRGARTISLFVDGKKF